MFSESGSLRVVVLAGGESAEREISLASGRAVIEALTAAGHRTRWVDPANCDLSEVAWEEVDACFIALHGGAGEDGRIQAQLESLGVCYTGSGPAASRLAMSKSAAKDRFLSAGLSTAPYHLLDFSDDNSGAAPLLCSAGVSPVAFGAGETPAPQIRRLPPLDELGFPLVVKPDGQGSSLGVGFAADDSQLAHRIAEARRFDKQILVEKWIDGRELTVAVAGGRPLPLIEIVTPRGLFDYEAKYESALTEYRFDHGLSQATADGITRLALAAVEAIGCIGLVRVDLMLDTQGRAWLLEVNTVPGLTEHSLAPKAAARAGITMPELCCWMLHEARVAEVTS